MEQNQEIAKIAYELYLMRGGAPGDPVADWVTAERIYAERISQSNTVRTIEEPMVSKEPPPATAKPRARKSAVKTAPTAATAKKTAAKAAPAKAEKKDTEAPKPRKGSRKNGTGSSVE